MTEVQRHSAVHAAHHSAVLSIGASPAIWFLCAAIVTLALVLGGGTKQGLWSDAFVQIASLVLLVALVFRARGQRRGPHDRLTLFIVIALLLLPLAQLISLPPSIWTSLPGREMFALAYDGARLGRPWLPISLDPAATWRSWLSLLPAIAVFFAVVALDQRARRSLSLLIVAVGMVSVFLGLAQLMQGPASPLRFYPFTNTGDSVGFFANRNHYAAFLTVLIPVVAAWAIGIVHDRRANRLFSLAVCLIVFAVLILGIGMARSRAGVALALVAAVASFFLVPAGERSLTRYSLSAIGAAAAVGIILAIHFAFFRVLGRFEADVLADLRFTIADVTASAIWTYFPFGSGFGTFEEIYRIFEPREALLPSYVNHAHDDWLEVLLEGGIFAAGLMVAFAAWFGIRGVKVWRTPADRGRVLDRALSRAATIGILLFLLFSIVEYPLRTTALSVVFAWLAALLVVSARAVPERENNVAARTVHVPRRRDARWQRRPDWARPRSMRGGV